MPDMPEITNVQRLTLKPGDRIIVRVPQKLTDASAAVLRERLRSWSGIPDDVPVLVLDDGMSLEVAGPDA